MPRPPRIEFPGAWYHVTSRGNHRQTIFHDDQDRERFLDRLQENAIQFEVDLFAYVLMSNHYHLLIRTRSANLSRFMQRLNTAYALYYRFRHRRPGHLFQGRFKAKLVEDRSYVRTLSRYIHLNPVKIKSCKGLDKAEKVRRLGNYRWSSYPGYIRRSLKAEWIDYALLDDFGGESNPARRRYRAYTEACVMESDQPLKALLQTEAHAIGSPHFVESVRQRLLERRKDPIADRDVHLPKAEFDLRRVDELIARTFGLEPEALREHGHQAREAKQWALEAAVRWTGLSQREVGRHYGGISSQAVGMARRKLKERGLDQEKLDRLIGRLRDG